MNNNDVKITVIDALMGKGKTSYAIQYMNEEALSKKIVYITPFLNEVERVITSCTNRKFVQPEASKGRKKKDNLKKLIAEGKDIVSTHALFKKIDDAMIELLKAEGYILILDEVMNVLEQEPISKDDLKLLITTPTASDNPCISVDEFGFCKWNDENYKSGEFVSIKRLADTNNLMLFNEIALYWTMPVNAFLAFEEVYILTYLFDGQIQKYYYDMFNVQYSYRSVSKINDRYELTEYVPFHFEDREELRELINIHYSDLNKIGDNKHSFSATKLKKYTSESDYAELRNKIKNNAYTFYRHRLKAHTDTIIWTTFKGDKDKVRKGLTPTGLAKKFVQVNCRATNEHQDKSVCIYLANIYFNPVMVQLFKGKGVEVNEELYALSELLQWLFRSRIRNNQSVELYIPSSRMRGLLEDYLNNK
ncbi:hypothetical protein ACFVP8_06470 [Viridibacillus arvi]|uniref:hypothetical protein n=1 Tax=Viridibacillus arvi TaxID=263475 RepID=UPI0036832101